MKWPRLIDMTSIRMENIIAPFFGQSNKNEVQGEKLS